jgi:hypothetical protein
MLRRLCLALVLLAGCRPGTPPPPGVHGGDPQTPEEKEVARRIAAGRKADVDWLAWGPHDLAGETHWHDPAAWKIIRVRWRERRKDDYPRVRDELYDVGPGAKRHPIPATNLWGDGWLEEARRDTGRLEDRARQ